MNNLSVLVNNTNDSKKTEYLLYKNSTLEFIKKRLISYNINDKASSVIIDVFNKIFNSNSNIYLSFNNINGIILELNNVFKNDDTNEEEFIQFYVEFILKNYKNKSKYLNDILEALQTGDENTTTELIKLLSRGLKENENISEELKEKINSGELFKNNWNEKPLSNDLTKEEKDNIKLIADDTVQKFYQDKGVKNFEDKNTSNNIENLLNNISLFSDNNNPYPLMLLSESININDIDNDLIYDLYNKAIKNPIIIELFDIYNKYKNDYIINIFEINNKYKYKITKQHQLLDYLIKYYELNQSKKIDSIRLHLILNKTLSYLNVTDYEINLNEFIEKYLIAINHRMIFSYDDFNRKFIEQYLSFIGHSILVDLF